jgi:DNA-directed RNA polymerase specialized sigma24 family protein
MSSDTQHAGEDDAGAGLHFGRVVTRHRATLYRRALTLAGGNHDRAEDLAQETLIKAFEARASFPRDGTDSERRWLLTVLRHACVDQERRSAKRDAVSLDTPVRKGGPPLGELIPGDSVGDDRFIERWYLKQVISSVTDLIERSPRAFGLSKRDVERFLAYHVDGVSLDDLAAPGEPRSAVADAVSRASSIFRNLFIGADADAAPSGQHGEPRDRNAPIGHTAPVDVDEAFEAVLRELESRVMDGLPGVEGITLSALACFGRYYSAARDPALRVPLEAVARDAGRPQSVVSGWLQRIEPVFSRIFKGRFAFIIEELKGQKPARQGFHLTRREELILRLSGATALLPRRRGRPRKAGAGRGEPP